MLLYVVYTLVMRPLEFGYEEVFMICCGLAAATTLVLDYRRDKQTAGVVMELVERIARLEANADDSVTLEARLVHLEAAVQRDEYLNERIAGYGERIAVLEVKYDNIPDVGDEDG